MWQVAGNVLLVFMTTSYTFSFILLAMLRPRDLLEWSIVAKVGSITAVFLNACLVVFFGLGTDQPTRMIVFGLATIANWVFTAVSWRAWLHRGGDG
jgi:O-antigen/teichoic acid export membrane protein